MIKHSNKQSFQLILCAFIYLIVGYGFAHYLTFVHWLANESRGSVAYYVYYINGIRTSGGGLMSTFIFLVLGIIVPALVFSAIGSAIDKAMKSKTETLAYGVSMTEYRRIERITADHAFFTATFLLTIIFTAVSVFMYYYLRHAMNGVSAFGVHYLNTRAREYWLLYGAFISRGCVIICSLFTLWGANAFDKPKKLRLYGYIAAIVALAVNIIYDFNSLFILFRFFDFMHIGAASESFLFLLAVAVIMICEKKGESHFSLTVFLSIGVIFLPLPIASQFKANVLDFLLAPQMMPLISLSIILAIFGNRLHNRGRLFY